MFSNINKNYRVCVQIKRSKSADLWDMNLVSIASHIQLPPDMAQARMHIAENKKKKPLILKNH